MTLIVPVKDWALKPSDYIDTLDFCEARLPKWAIRFWTDLTIHEIPEAGCALMQAQLEQGQHLTHCCRNWKAVHKMEISGTVAA